METAQSVALDCSRFCAVRTYIKTKRDHHGAGFRRFGSRNGDSTVPCNFLFFIHRSSFGASIRQLEKNRNLWRVGSPSRDRTLSFDLSLLTMASRNPDYLYR